MKTASLVIRAVSAGVLLLQCGCMGSTPPASFYLLEPLSSAQATQAEPEPVSGRPILALASVRIPQYLQRPELVSASGKNTYVLDELHRWAEALDDNISRVMLQDLAVLIPAEVMSVSSSRSRPSDLRLAVTVLEFHIDPQNQARLSVQWQLSDGGERLVAKQSSYKVAADSADTPAKVFALNQCLNRLNRDLAAAVRAEIANGAAATTSHGKND
jgi:uncharacterized lipoprotein YmbA